MGDREPPDWALPIPKLIEGGYPGVKRFGFELDGLPPGAKPEGAALKFTLVGGGDGAGAERGRTGFAS